MNDAQTRLELSRHLLTLLIRFHDREVDIDFLQGVRHADTVELFMAILPDDQAQQAVKDYANALKALPDPIKPEDIDLLAAEYADVYLTHSYRLSPAASVWLTEEKLERQEPMFEVREWYDYYGISVPNWRARTDDHIVHELQFIEHLLGLGTDAATRDAARFMDRHILVWVPQFCALMAERCSEPLLIAIARLTIHYLSGLRDVLLDVTGQERWVPAEDEKVIPYSLTELDEDVAFMPGVTESW